MTEISATSAAARPTPVVPALGAPASQPAGEALGKDAFLQLMVAQLRYQDPSSPVDSAQFLAQTAQFTNVEKLEQLLRTQTEAASVQQRLSAASLVGQQVSWPAADGTPRTGVVTAVRLAPGAEPQVQVGTEAVPLSSLTEISRPGTAPAGS